MHRTLFSLIFFFVILILIEYYSFSAIKFAFKNVKPTLRNTSIGIYIFFTLLFYSLFLLIPTLRNTDDHRELRSVIVCFAIGFLFMKLAISVVLGLEDLRRCIVYISSLFFHPQRTPQVITQGITRSQFMSKAALALGGSLFATVLIGTLNKYRYKIHSLQLKFPKLPQAFAGLRIVQISDIHSGSFTNVEAVQKGIDRINQLKPDVIFFTGDLVNNRATEMADYITIFKQLTAPLGVYSILGNHDYGDYVQWDNPKEKEKNLNSLKNIHAQLGWKLLLNEHLFLEKENQKIALIGVENISGRGRFHSYGNLQKATENLSSTEFQILLSHDPSHWDAEVNKHYPQIALTLSGHTHGMQFGIELPWIKWSPVKYIYKQWAGLYQQNQQYLYVNRGFGFLGYPGRVGILPEITLLELT